MGISFADILGRHPSFVVGVVQGVLIQWYVCSDDEAIRAICDHGGLHLGGLFSWSVGQHVGLVAVSDALEALTSPYE